MRQKCASPGKDDPTIGAAVGPVEPPAAAAVPLDRVRRDLSGLGGGPGSP